MEEKGYGKYEYKMIYYICKEMGTSNNSDSESTPAIMAAATGIPSHGRSRLDSETPEVLCKYIYPRILRDGPQFEQEGNMCLQLLLVTSEAMSVL